MKNTYEHPTTGRVRALLDLGLCYCQELYHKGRMKFALLLLDYRIATVHFELNKVAIAVLNDSSIEVYKKLKRICVDNNLPVVDFYTLTRMLISKSKIIIKSKKDELVITVHYK